MSTQPAKKVMKPLGMRCTDTDCANGLHYLRPTKKHPLGTCRTCGVRPPIDWDRLHRRDISDVAYTIQCFQAENVRHHMWNVEIDNAAVAKAKTLGTIGIAESVQRRIRTKTFSSVPHPVFDGRQTPREGNVIYYAQHATGTCCRKCMSYWHGIPMDRPLTEAEIAFLVAMILEFCKRRLGYIGLDFASGLIGEQPHGNVNAM